MFIDVYWCVLMCIDVYWCVLMCIDVYCIHLATMKAGPQPPVTSTYVAQGIGHGSTGDGLHLHETPALSPLRPLWPHQLQADLFAPCTSSQGWTGGLWISYTNRSLGTKYQGSSFTSDIAGMLCSSNYDLLTIRLTFHESRLEALILKAKVLHGDLDGQRLHNILKIFKVPKVAKVRQSANPFSRSKGCHWYPERILFQGVSIMYR